ncbi:MAG: leucine-rich repeat domain-containing protein, partial [Clostridia bacterium]
QESMYVVATALGEELNVVVEDTYHGQIKFKNNASVSEEVLVEGQPKTCRYGDLLDVTFTPNAGYNYAYGYINGDLVEGQKATKKVINHVYITGQFFNNTTRYINIDSNGGVGNDGAVFVCKQYFNEEKRFETLDEYTKPNDLYINLHDYSTKMKRDGHKLVGFNTLDEFGTVNDTFRLRGLVANIYPWQKPGEMQTLKAIWEKETPETIAENGNQSPVFLYEESGGNIILKGLTAQGKAWLADPKKNGKIVIPEIIAGKKVVAIADNAFEGYNDLKEIILAKNIERVGNFAFKNCQNITTFWFTDSVTQIDDNIFTGCPKITTLKINNYKKRIYKYGVHGCFSEKMMWYK